MTQSSTAKLLRVNDLKVAQLLTDSSNPSALSYGSFVDVPNIREISIDEKSESFEDYADDQLDDVEVLMHGYTFSFQNSKVSLPALAILEGGTVSASGSAPNQVTTYKRNKSDSRQYFKMQGKTKAKNEAGDVVDAHVILYKCKCDKISYTLGKEYAVVSASGIAIPLKNNGDVKDLKFNQADTAIS